MDPVSAASDNVNAFQALCRRFIRCHLQTAHRCANRFDESEWATKSHFAFLIWVVCVMACKCVLEVLKMAAICCCVWQRRLLWPDALPCFIRSSPVVPLLLAVPGVDVWRDVWLSPVTAHDHLLGLIWQTLLAQLPMLGVTLWFFTEVLQTGFGSLDYLSVVSGVFLLPMGLVRAWWAWRQREAEKQRTATLEMELSMTSTLDEPLLAPLSSEWP